MVWGWESWEVSTYPNMESEIADGPMKGRLLSEVIGGEFPLLVKYINAREDLSIQVHPDDAMAKAKHGPGFRGKTEMWYVVDAAPGASLYCGLKEKIGMEEYERRVKDGTITDVLDRYEVSPGDVFFLPAGRIHAICSGCFLAEIQQTSDLTYRIWDYNRPGLDGKPRQLHTELAKEAIDYTVLPDYQTRYTPAKDQEVVIVSCKYFTTSIFDLTKPVEKVLPDSYLVVMCLDGAGDVGGVPVKKGETLLVPASLGKVTFTPHGSMKLLTSHA